MSCRLKRIVCFVGSTTYLYNRRSATWSKWQGYRCRIDTDTHNIYYSSSNLSLPKVRVGTLCPCPAGQTLTYSGSDYLRGYNEYATGKGVCARCHLRPQCTCSKEGRTINRYPLQGVLDRARRQSASKRGIEDRKRRQHLQERNFADAANHRGFKRSRWRGLWRQSLQDYLIAALQNLRLLIRAGLVAAHQLVAALCTCLIALLWTATPQPQNSQRFAL